MPKSQRHEFNKYDLKGAYHWQGYEKGGSYTRSVNETVVIINQYYSSRNIVNPKLLDIGCGDGVFTKLLNAYGIDNCPTAIELAKEHNVTCELLPALQLNKLQNKTWDGVLMFDYFEHEENQTRLLKLISEVSKVIHILNPFPCNSPHHTIEFTSFQLIRFMEVNGWKKYLHHSAPMFFRDLKDFFIFEKI